MIVYSNRSGWCKLGDDRQHVSTDLSRRTQSGEMALLSNEEGSLADD